jgi:hypothetical protein
VVVVRLLGLRGVERESEENSSEKLRLFSFDWFRINKHSILISRL